MPKEKTTTRKTKARGEKRKKDPEAPKRPLSAYMHFAQDQRENVRDENPGIAFGQVGKVLGERWKALNDSQRSVWEEKAQKAKASYVNEKAAYDAKKKYEA